MKENWTYPDLIDLEYCLSLDKDHQQTSLHKRDREIYLSSPEAIKNGGQDRLIDHWLENRRKRLFAETAAKSPGHIAAESYRSLAYLLTMCGTILGFIGGFSFLAYSGSTPVNVLNFLFLFIFSQLLVMAVIFPVAGLRMAGFSSIPAPIISLYALVSSWFSRQITRLSTHIPAEKRMGYNQIAGIWKKQQSRYRQVTYWPLFSLSQYTMTGFNLGLLTATIYRLITSDIAFGWQSTIQFSDQFIHRTVSMLALPWSWFIPDQYAYPSVNEIEGSRIILKDGIYHLATQDLVSWWPFLVLCIIVYGLLLRFLLVLIGKIGRKRSLQKLQLNTPALIQLVQRMQSPLITSQAETASNRNREYTAAAATGNRDKKDHAVCSTILLIPAEMIEHFDKTRIAAHLKRAGFTVTDHKIFMAGYDADRTVIRELASLSWSSDTGIATLMESWMPPINETLLFLRNLRSAVGLTVPIWVVLAGQSDNEGSLTKPSEADRFVWQQKMDELADPYLDLIDI